MSESSATVRSVIGAVLLVLSGAAYVVVSFGVYFFAALNSHGAGEDHTDPSALLLTMAGFGLLVVGSAALAGGAKGAWSAGMTVAVLNGAVALVVTSPTAVAYLAVIAILFVARADALARPDR